MKASNTRYAFLALIAVTFLYTGCQKAASGVRAKKGIVGGPSASSPEDTKLEELVKQKKSSATCTERLQEKYIAWQTELETTQEILEKNKGKEISAEVKKDLTSRSAQIKALMEAIKVEFLNEKIASCGSGKELISIDDIRQTSDETFIAISDLIGKETVESLRARARQNQKKKDTIQNSESLIGQKLNPAKGLIDFMVEQNEKSDLVIAEGKITTQKDSDPKAVATEDVGFCSLENAPEQKLKESTQLTVLKADVTISEVLVQAEDKTSSIKKTTQLLVQMSSEGLLLSFNCRLGKEVQQQSVVEQIFKIFGTLLEKAEKSDKSTEQTEQN